MKLKNDHKNYFYIIQNSFLTFSLMSFILISNLFLSTKVFSLEKITGEKLFIENCSGCHINGGNIIRRNKTLKLKDLKRNGIDSTEEIARIARDGIGIMSGYKEVLGEQGDKLVANWILKQSQKAWSQG